MAFPRIAPLAAGSLLSACLFLEQDFDKELSPEAQGPSSGASPDGCSPTGLPACARCLHDTCCGEVEACQDDAGCAACLACLEQGGTRASCVMSGACVEGVATTDGILGCAGGACTNECSMGLGPCDERIDDPSCLACAKTACCPEVTACLVEPACTTCWSCLEAGGNQTNCPSCTNMPSMVTTNLFTCLFGSDPQCSACFGLPG